MSWEAVAKIVVTVDTDTIDDTRLDELYRIGVDEVSYRKGHRYLTVVADHDRDGAVVWASEGRDRSTLEAFYEELGAERVERLEVVTLDMGGALRGRHQRQGRPRDPVRGSVPSGEVGQRGRRQGAP